MNAANAGHAVRSAFYAPGLVLLLVALGGRYSLEQAGLSDADLIQLFGLVDLRVLGIAVGLALLAFDLSRRAPVPLASHRPEGWLVVATLFFLYQAASGLWAPAHARTGTTALDVVLMAVLTLAIYTYTKGDPGAVICWTFLFFYAAAVVFALAALLLTGPDVQGRYAAFGGGPNVFVRVEILGVIGAVALFRFKGWKATLLAVPLLLFAAALSGSRAGLLAGAVVAAVALYRVRHRLAAAPTLVVVPVGVGIAAIVWAFAPAGIRDLLEDRFVDQTAQRYASGRTDIWWETIRVAADHPIFGAGLDGFYGLVGRAQGVEYPHHYVLAVAAEGGAIGLALLGGTFLLWLRTVRRGGGYPAETGMAVAAAAFVAISSLFSGDYYDARLAWLFAAMAAAAATSQRPGNSTHQFRLETTLVGVTPRRTGRTCTAETAAGVSPPSRRLAR